jgi:iron complex transport system permease protein
VILILLFVLNMSIGSVYIPLSEVLNPTGVYRTILMIIRLPEAVGAIIIGIDLAIAGAAMQSTLRNPLADPYITGTASGAVLGTVIGLSIGFVSVTLNKFVIFLQPVFGFLGAMFATLLVILFSKKGNWLTLVLAGIAISILLSSFVTIMDSYLLTKAASAYSIFFLLFGSLGGLNWNKDILIIISSVPVLLFLALSRKKLNLIMMSDEITHSTGVNAHRFRITTLLASSILTALALSFTGVIGFVGLVSPHIARFVLKDVNNAKVMPVCALIGADILLFANFTSKIIIPNTVVPITAITSLIGAPILIYFIIKSDRSARAY